MSKLRKITAIILALLMISSVCAFSLNVNAEETVKIIEYDYVVSEKLRILDVVDTVDDTQLTEFVLRKDMVSILMKYLLVESATLSGETTPFLDVSLYDENIGAYRVLNQMGYISGDENKMFRPLDYLTYNEAIKLIVSAMGYTPYAERNGGYPAGYLYTANKYGLLKALRGGGQNPIPYCDLYRLIEASLYADAVVYRYLGGENNGTFELDESRTVLEETYGYKYVSGVVTGNEDTRLHSQSSSRIDRYQIEIENVVYETPGKEYAGLLGRYAYGYAKGNADDGYEIIYLERDEKRNSEVELSAEILLKDKTTSSRIYYEDEDYKERYINVNSSALSVIYNGKMRTGYGQLKNVLPSEGYILGVDNSGDEAIDVLFVYEYENVVVKAVDRHNFKVYDKLDALNVKVLDKVEDEIRIYDENGEEMSFEDITKGDILSIMKSTLTSDYEIITAYVMRKTVEGAVSQKVGNKYLIGDTYYELAKNFSDYLTANGKSIKLGENATYYLDYSGKIAYYSAPVATDAKYGVIYGIHDETGLDRSIKLKIFTQDANWIESYVADSVMLDGVRRKIEDTTDFNTLKTDINAVIGQVILYNYNTSDEITYIDRPNTTREEGKLTQMFYGSRYTYRKGVVSSRVADAGWSQIYAKSGEIIVFRVPEYDPAMFIDPTKDAMLRNWNDVDRWTVDNKVSTVDTDVSSPYYMYNTGSDGVPVATCMLICGGTTGSSEIKPGSAYYVVTGKTTGIDSEGDVRTKLYYSKQGAEESCFVESNIDYSKASAQSVDSAITGAVSTPFADLNLKVGDIIQLGKNANGRISSINVIYRLTPAGVGEEAGAAITSLPFNNSSAGNPSGTTAGTLADTDLTKNILSIDTIEPPSLTTSTQRPAQQVINSCTDITIYIRGSKNTMGGTLADLIPSDTIFVRYANSFGSSASQIIVIR